MIQQVIQTENTHKTKIVIDPRFLACRAINKKYTKLSAQTSNTSYMPCYEPVSDIQINTAKKHSFNTTVDPIKEQSQIKAAKQYFLNQPQRYKNNPINIRNYTLFVFTINCARRIGDILKLNIGDILNDDFTFRYYIGKNQSIGIVEQKTSKTIRVPLNNDAKEALQMYFNTMSKIDLSAPLFKSRVSKDINKAQQEYNKAFLTNDENKIDYKKQRLDIAINFTHTLEPRSVSKIIKTMSREIGLDKQGLNINTHSMRKTCVHFIYRMTKDLELCRIILNHSKIETTRRYLGINQDEINAAIMAI